MKHLGIIFFIMFGSVCSAKGQAPQGFNYQAVLRDTDGEILANTNVTMKFTIQVSAAVNSTIKYQESQALTTNEYGLINCAIGIGTVLQGNILTVDWEAGSRFLKVEANIGNGFVNLGTHQLMSVPYALSALRTPNAWGTTGNEDTNPELNFIGTIDSAPLNFRVYDEPAGLIDPESRSVFFGSMSGSENEADANTFIGNNSGTNNVDGTSNTSLGSETLYNNVSGNENIAIGDSAGFSCETGSQNIYIGKSAGQGEEACFHNVAIGTDAMGWIYAFGHENVGIGSGALFKGGNRCVAIGHEAGYDGNQFSSYGDVLIGYRAGYLKRNGTYNVVIGYEAGYNLGKDDSFYEGGDRNVFIGMRAGYNNVGDDWYQSGEENTFLGFQAGYMNGQVPESFSASKNTFIGCYSGANNTTGYGNSAIGHSAGNDNTTGSYNTFFGLYSGSNNTTAHYNTFIGYNCGASNITGENNTMIGRSAGYENTAGFDNFFAGAEAGEENTIGYSNTFVGRETGILNINGYKNTFLGASAGGENINGFENTFVGMNAGLNNSDADHNTAIGFDAGGSQTTGDDCTFLGYSAECASGSFSNSTAIGYQASVTASNRVRIGNTSITQIGGQVGWSTLSDERLKKNIQPSSLGLSFINMLTPVSYNYIEGNTDTRYTGFIAQDVERVLSELDMEFSGVTRPENEYDYYSIRYAEFVVPLVNAVQELSKQNEIMKSELNDVKTSNAKLSQDQKNMEKTILELKHQVEVLISNSTK